MLFFSQPASNKKACSFYIISIVVSLQWVLAKTSPMVSFHSPVLGQEDIAHTQSSFSLSYLSLGPYFLPKQ